MAAFRLTVRSFRTLAGKYGGSALCHGLEMPKYLQCSLFSLGNIVRNDQESSSTSSNPPNRVNFIESQDPEEWKFVERLLPPTVVPEPVLKKEYPSGWKPPSDEAVKLPYFVSRSKNHMIPVYLWIGHRGIGRRTTVKHIRGDIWALEKELTEYLAQMAGKKILSQVHEMAGWILYKGDHVTNCRTWLESKGF